MAVFATRSARERALIPPQSPRRFTALACLLFARPTKTTQANK